MAAKKKGRRAEARRRGARARPGAGRDTAKASNPIWIPAAFTVFLLLLCASPRIQENPRLLASFLAASATLFVFLAAVMRRAALSWVSPEVEFVLRPQHWVQALCQLAVFAYWGWYWRDVYSFAPLILGQLLFAYAFDILLTWWRGERYKLGFGPFPIIFSINLFLWFKDDWFYLQFLMIAVGILGKMLVRWERDGRRVHIFNPSAFALGLFSLVLIATNTTDLTWGVEIASTLTLAPSIYAYLFAVGLVVMFFFSITLVAGFAAATLFAGSAIYAAITGVPYFVDSEIPAAVFLGLHLLITDPSTSPRTPAGKAVFGVCYGVGVFALYTILGAVGAPTFYDKLLCVPLLNLSVRWIDAWVARIRETGALEVLRLEQPTTRLNWAHMGVWIVFFGVMTVSGRTDGTHLGDKLPFWVEACAEDRALACERLVSIESNYCADNSAWACNELGIHYAEGNIVEADPERAIGFFGRACELRFQPACVNILDPTVSARANPKALDLRLLLREGGQNLMEAPEATLARRACDHGWGFACSSTGAP